MTRNCVVLLRKRAFSLFLAGVLVAVAAEDSVHRAHREDMSVDAQGKSSLWVRGHHLDALSVPPGEKIDITTMMGNDVAPQDFPTRKSAHTTDKEGQEESSEDDADIDKVEKENDKEVAEMEAQNENDADVNTESDNGKEADEDVPNEETKTSSSKIVARTLSADDTCNQESATERTGCLDQLLKRCRGEDAACFRKEGTRCVVDNVVRRDRCSRVTEVACRQEALEKFKKCTKTATTKTCNLQYGKDKIKCSGESICKAKNEAKKTACFENPCNKKCKDACKVTQIVSNADCRDALSVHICRDDALTDHSQCVVSKGYEERCVDFDCIDAVAAVCDSAWQTQSSKCGV